MPKTLQRGFAPIILLFVVALIAVGVGAYLYGKGGIRLPTQKQPASSGAQVSETPTPTPDETANWKTYTDAKQNYSIKYPATLYLESEDPVTLLYEIYKGKTRATQPEVGVLIEENSTLEEKLASLKNLQSQGVAVSNYEEKDINGVKAYQFNNVTNNSGSVVTILGKNNKVYNIDLLVSGEFNEEIERTYKQVVSTFKFTQ